MLSLFPQPTSDSRITAITPIKIPSKSLVTPLKLQTKLDSESISPLRRLKGESGASPLKRPGRQTLAAISKENLAKFD